MADISSLRARVGLSDLKFRASIHEAKIEDMSVVERADYWLATFDAQCLNLWFKNGLLASSGDTGSTKTGTLATQRASRSQDLRGPTSR
jgi:hypothetical protein